MPEQLIKDNIATLQQAETLLMTVAGSTLNLGERIGPHLRHVLDHYDCFLDGLAQQRIDYDQRCRDAATETSISTAQQRLARTNARLAELSPARWPSRLKIRLATSNDAEGCFSWSTPERELQFLQSHAVHHYALIRLLLEAHGVRIDADFGKAPSTIQFERASA